MRTSAMKLDTEAHTVTLSNKDVMPLRQAAARHRRQRAPAARRRLATSRASTTCARSATPISIRDDAEGAEHVVLIGGSYIATEVAATLTALGPQVQRS